MKTFCKNADQTWQVNVESNPILALDLAHLSLNLSMSMTVILAPSRVPTDERLNSDPLESHWTAKLLPNPPLCFMFFFTMRFIWHQEASQIH